MYQIVFFQKAHVPAKLMLLTSKMTAHCSRKRWCATWKLKFASLAIASIMEFLREPRILENLDNIIFKQWVHVEKTSFFSHQLNP